MDIFHLFTDIEWLRLILVCLGIVGMSVSFTTVYLFSGELFPTVVRNIGVGTSSMCARIGSITAPFVVSLVSFVIHDNHTKLYIVDNHFLLYHILLYHHLFLYNFFKGSYPNLASTFVFWNPSSSRSRALLFIARNCWMHTSGNAPRW